MSNINETLAIQIVEKLKQEGLINATDKQLVIKLTNGSMKDSDWKIALEEIINTPAQPTINTDETKEPIHSIF